MRLFRSRRVGGVNLLLEGGVMSNRVSALVMTSCAVVVLSSPILFGAPAQWSGNGHYYEVIADGSRPDWYTSKAAAEAAGGYLATITSPEENTFIASLLPAGEAYFMGGFQPAGSLDPAVGWEWITGEPLVYTNWHPGQPSNGWIGGESALYIYGPNCPYREPEAGYWNDIYPDSHPGGYVVEWTPEPASLLMLIVGFAFLRRRA
jgi:hypothetical protein